MAISNEFLTGGAADGTGILVVATATAGTTIHTVPSSVKDRVRIYARNSDTSIVKLTIEFGGATVPDDLIVANLQPDTTTEIVPALLLDETLVVRAFAGTASVITLFGDITRIT